MFGVFLVGNDHEWLIEEYLFTLRVRYAVLFPVFSAVPIVPIEAREFVEQEHACILLLYTEPAGRQGARYRWRVYRDRLLGRAIELDCELPLLVEEAPAPIRPL